MRLMNRHKYIYSILILLLVSCTFSGTKDLTINSDIIDRPIGTPIKLKQQLKILK